MNFAEIQAIVNNNVKENNEQLITGTVLNFVLNQVLNYFSQKTNVIEIEGTGVNITYNNLEKEMIVAIAIKSTVTGQFVNIGLTNNGAEIVENYECPANKWNVIEINYLSSQTENIFISGLTAVSQIRIYKN